METVLLRFQCKFCRARYQLAALPHQVKAMAADWAKRHQPCTGGVEARIDCSGRVQEKGALRPVLTAVLTPVLPRQP